MSKSFGLTVSFSGAQRRFLFITEEEIDAENRWAEAKRRTQELAKTPVTGDRYWDELVEIMRVQGFHQARE